MAQVADWGAVSTDEDEIAQALVSIGPLSVLLNAEKLQFYKEGVFSPSHCNPEVKGPRSSSWLMYVLCYYMLTRNIGMCTVPGSCGAPDGVRDGPRHRN